MQNYSTHECFGNYPLAIGTRREHAKVARAIARVAVPQSAARQQQQLAKECVTFHSRWLAGSEDQCTSSSSGSVTATHKHNERRWRRRRFVDVVARRRWRGDAFRTVVRWPYNECWLRDRAPSMVGILPDERSVIMLQFSCARQCGEQLRRIRFGCALRGEILRT